jgi:hypothetical protein
MAPRGSNRSTFLASLIRTAYLPQEVPPAVTTKYFSDFCKTEFTFLKGEQDKLIKQTTKFDTFTAPRATPGRRNLAIVHPLAQLGLSLLLTQHRSKIRRIINKSPTSLYSAVEDPDKWRAFSGLDFPRWERETARLCSEFPILLRADISRFFYTAYTHSIPWAIVGKERVKEWLVSNYAKLKAHWANQLDTALQSCNSRERADNRACEEAFAK